MLASQRTSRTQRGFAQKAVFDPVEILPDGAGAPIAGHSVGPLKKHGRELSSGGFQADLSLGFRVLRASFATAAVGQTLKWRLPGETPYRGTLRIADIDDRASSPYLVLRCVNPHR